MKTIWTIHEKLLVKMTYFFLMKGVNILFSPSKMGEY